VVEAQTAESEPPAENLAVPQRVDEVVWPPTGTSGSSTGGCDRPQWPAVKERSLTTAPGHGRRVMMIGDSLTREISLDDDGLPTSPAVRAALTAQGWTPTVVCWKGRTTEWASRQVAELDQLDLIPPRVVLAMGTNDLWVDDAPAAEFEEHARMLLTELATTRGGGDNAPHVYWVNLWIDTAMAKWNHEREPRDPDMAEYETYNDVLSRVCTQATNCELIDWHDAVESDASLPARIVEPDLDGVHMTMAGAKARAEVIVQSLR